ncbi:hypothetical protein CUPS3785_05685 [Campylobacter upsaliensis]|uniref:hypothetical protein n=1 Tax=Campylobacter TaxID=194 RepID=UPI0011120C97|nr:MULTISPECIES: hypothetical protein [Campylobacter]MCR2066120.1 hypothetical protein [Campylobacter helveticus]MCR2122564.1 hypothetical protein [Campylobacter upsaliensis]TNB54183.1 hypothetical protein FDW47_08880 [Campylobacter helveticus]TNB56679.1 hypothetical protein FDW44_07920 [Campylobacter helveticus]TNB59098.1 hypothetical protein FDR72_08855 [Campylobacter helveticus]
MNEIFKENSKLYKQNQILVCEEKRKKLKLETRERNFYRIKIDEGVSQDNKHKKCDFIILETMKHICIYVELKGKKLKDAFEQIGESYNNYNSFFKKDTKRYAVIVFSKCPKQDTSIQNLKTQLREKGFRGIFQKENLIELFYDKNDEKDPIKMK